MSAPRLTVRIQLQQDHGFSRPLFRKPRRRRWPWWLLALLIGGGVALYLNPGALRQLPSSLTTAHSGAPLATPVAVATSASPQSATTTTIDVVVAPVDPVPAEDEPAPVEQTSASAPVVTPQPDAVVAEDLSPAPAAPEPEATPVVEQPSSALAAEPVAATTPQAATSEQIAAAIGTQPSAAAAPAASHVTRALLAANIAEREPVALIDTNRPLQLGTPTALFYFTELRDLNGRRVVHRWYHNGTMVKERAIDVGAIRWRTWSRHVLDDLSGGDWKVELVDSQGAVLAESHWQVAAPVVTPTP